MAPEGLRPFPASCQLHQAHLVSPLVTPANGSHCSSSKAPVLSRLRTFKHAALPSVRRCPSSDPSPHVLLLLHGHLHHPPPCECILLLFYYLPSLLSLTGPTTMSLQVLPTATAQHLPLPLAFGPVRAGTVCVFRSTLNPGLLEVPGI